MPFDPQGFSPNVTVLPPTDGGGPRRVHIEIEIVERRPRRTPGLSWWWLIAATLLLGGVL